MLFFSLLNRVVREELSTRRCLSRDLSVPRGWEGRMFWLEERASAKVPKLEERK